MGIVLVTGGSRGIGAATARLAARDGHDVAISYRANRDEADKVVADITAMGRRALAVQGDVAEEDDILRVFGIVDEELGPLDALVNNAGVVDMAARVEDMSAARIERMMRINVVGAFVCAREAVRRMSTQHGGRGGSIVNVSSVAVRLTAANLYVDYAASKAAVDTMTLGLAREVARDGIRVNAVRPGTIVTDIHADSGDIDRPAKIAADIPAGRPGEAAEVAEAIVWLISEKASYVNGAILDVTGAR